MSDGGRIRGGWLAAWAVLGVAAGGLCTGCGSEAVASSVAPQPFAAELQLDDSRPSLLARERPHLHDVGWTVTEGVRMWTLQDGALQIHAPVGAAVEASLRTSVDFAAVNRATLRLRVRDIDSSHPFRAEVSFFDANGDNRFWRPVELRRAGYHDIDIELPMTRYDRGTLPRWEQVASWGLSFRSVAQIEIEDIYFWRDAGDGDASPYLDVATLREAFSPGSEVREVRHGSFVVMTNAQQLQMEPLLAALDRMEAQTRDRFGAVLREVDDVPLLIFATEAEYRAFWQRFSERMGANAQPFAGDEGFTWLGIASAFYDDRSGLVRPVYVHEASHAYLERGLHLAAQRSWLFEGLGNLAQLDVSTQDMRRAYRSALRQPHLHASFDTLLSGEAISTKHYWQATLLLEWLTSDPLRATALNAAIADMQESGSTDLRPWMSARFALPPEQFEQAFWSWAFERYLPGARRR